MYACSSRSSWFPVFFSWKGLNSGCPQEDNENRSKYMYQCTTGTIFIYHRRFYRLHTVCRVFHRFKNRSFPTIHYPQLCISLNLNEKRCLSRVAIKSGSHNEAVDVRYISPPGLLGSPQSHKPQTQGRRICNDISGACPYIPRSDDSGVISASK